MFSLLSLDPNAGMSSTVASDIYNAIADFCAPVLSVVFSFSNPIGIACMCVFFGGLFFAIVKSVLKG